MASLHESKIDDMKTSALGGKPTSAPAIGGGAAQLVATIKRDHDTVRQMYATQYKTAATPVARFEIARKMISELVMHSGKEEIVLYPMFRKVLPNGDAEAEKSKDEHQQLTNDMYKLETLSPEKDAAQVDAMMDQIMREFEMHATDEETRVLPLFSQHCPANQGVDLLESWNKAAVTTRPHPMAPREGVAAQMAHMGSIPLDAMKDAMHKPAASSSK